MEGVRREPARSGKGHLSRNVTALMHPSRLRGGMPCGPRRYRCRPLPMASIPLPVLCTIRGPISRPTHTTLSNRSGLRWLRHVFADGGYAGDKLKAALIKIGKWTLEIIRRSDRARGFEVLPRR